MKNHFWAALSLLACAGCTTVRLSEKIDSVSGIYPSLAYYNNEGECGTGAVVPWANRLWIVTYGPHLPMGSSDKLYEITPDLKQIVRSESIGGTPANRMIHRESGQLFIGPHAIDSTGRVRTIPYKTMPGRHTGNARHLTDPAHKIYYGTMEEGIYEVDVHTLAVKELYHDANFQKKPDGTKGYGPIGAMLPGVHGKGLYSGQGVLLFTNNGEGSQEALTQFDIEAGVLAEWNGKDWKVVRRNQFVEVTGPGGICGNSHPETDPIWATGWDYKSVILGVRDPKLGWSFYRLPKASHSYDGAHGWNTEWPRIRNVGTEAEPDYLMTMHGMFWKFPSHFTARSSAGIRPRSAYLKVIGDFARWNDKLVFGCDDTAQKEFLNKRKAKGSLPGPGQSNSNVWFTSLDKPDELGPTTATGSVWMDESVKAGEYSEPFLFAGWPYRSVWLKNDGAVQATFTFEVDLSGNGQWSVLKQITLAPGAAEHIAFDSSDAGEWIRVQSDSPTKATACFTYSGEENRKRKAASLFTGLAKVSDTQEHLGGLLYSLGNNRRTLGLLSYRYVNGQPAVTGYYEMNDTLQLIRKEDEKTRKFIEEKCVVPSKVVSIEASSVLITDDKGRRWRLPLGEQQFASLTDKAQLRICREVATERDLFSCMGTFYELPAENADGFAKIRPISTHDYQIHDYASYRGMILLTGVKPEKGKRNPHIIVSQDGQAAVWAGVIDDLWQLGKPRGQGGPWWNQQVQAGVYSDPYLISCYDRKKLTLSHQSSEKVTFTVEVDPTGDGNWMAYATYAVKSGEHFTHQFSDSFQARWIRFKTDKSALVTTWLDYD